MNSENLRRVYFREAIRHDQRGDKEMWISALFCSKVVGNYEKGATLGLADDMSRSTDTIEDRAHGYWLFQELCNLDGGEYRRFVFNARRAPFIHFAHFRELYDLKNSYNLHITQVLSLLMDVVQAEGGISSRKLGDVVRNKYGDTRDWTFYAGKTQKELSKLLQQPDLPDEGRKKAQDLFSFLGDMA